MRSLRGALAASIVLSAACGDAGPPPAAPGAPIDPPRENPDLAAMMMEASPSTPATTQPAPEPPPSASASASAAAPASSADAKAPEKKPAEKKPAEKKPAEKKPAEKKP